MIDDKIRYSRGKPTREEVSTLPWSISNNREVGGEHRPAVDHRELVEDKGDATWVGS